MNQPKIYVSTEADGSCHVVNGHRLLRAALDLLGRAEVVDVATQETLFVHEVGDRIVVLTAQKEAFVEKCASAVIEAARNGSPGK